MEKLITEQSFGGRRVRLTDLAIVHVRGDRPTAAICVGFTHDYPLWAPLIRPPTMAVRLEYCENLNELGLYGWMWPDRAV